MNFNAKRLEQLKIRSLGDMKRSGKVKESSDPALLINGPLEFDCLMNGWKLGELLSIVGDSGCGKTEVLLAIQVSILKSNPDKIAIYVSLEMTDQEVYKRLSDMVGEGSDILDRFFIISRYDDEGNSKAVSIDWIKNELDRYNEALGNIICFAIDHVHCLGENDPSTLNSIMIKLKEMAVSLNCLGIPLAQVNKSAGGKGEVPLDADSVLGCSQLKYISSNIIQIHRPILRLEEEAKISVLGWGYCKIREPHKQDPVKRGQNKLLTYDLDTRKLRKLTTNEYSIFKMYYNELLEMKSAEEKSKAFSYDITKEVQGKDGKMIQIKEIFSGDSGE